MNSFEQHFFKKYIPEWLEIKWVIHEHIVVILDKLILWLSFWAIIPSFLYYQSDALKQLIPFYVLEIYLIIAFIKIVYEIFNWYNDVWIITNESVIDLDWAIFKTDAKSVKYENIEWVWVEQDGIWDKILNKWTVVIHKIWDDSFHINNAVIPYEAVNEIERISKEKLSGSGKEDRFDLMMNALSWVVDDYLERKWLRQDYQNRNGYTYDDNKVEEMRDLDSTIDLR